MKFTKTTVAFTAAVLSTLDEDVASLWPLSVGFWIYLFLICSSELQGYFDRGQHETLWLIDVVW